MTQSEVAKIIGRNQQIIGHWETGYAQPDANTLFILCEIYNTTVDKAFGFNQSTNNISDNEYLYIKKYRKLDEHGLKIVNLVLQEEFERCSTINNIEEMPQHLLVNAAHERTDIEISDEMRKHDDDIMNDDNF